MCVGIYQLKRREEISQQIAIQSKSSVTTLGMYVHQWNYFVIKGESCSSGGNCKCDQCKLLCLESKKNRTCVCTMEKVQ